MKLPTTFQFENLLFNISMIFGIYFPIQCRSICSALFISLISLHPDINNKLQSSQSSRNELLSHSPSINQ